MGDVSRGAMAWSTSYGLTCKYLPPAFVCVWQRMVLQSATPSDCTWLVALSVSRERRYETGRASVC